MVCAEGKLTEPLRGALAARETVVKCPCEDVSLIVSNGVVHPLAERQRSESGATARWALSRVVVSASAYIVHGIIIS
jgi:hypothetical protein